MTKYAKVSAGLVAAWFVFAIAASALQVFNTGGPPLAVGLAALMPIILFAIWFATSPGFRKFLMSLDARVVTLVHSWRVLGFAFVAFAAYKILPNMFALPAGWGDIAIGVTAPFVALKLARSEHRGSFIAWQFLGILDLVVAITLGTLSGIINPHGISTAAMAVLPLSVVPTFGVPMLLILHFISIAQARQWSPQEAVGVGRQLYSSAA